MFRRVRREAPRLPVGVVADPLSEEELLTLLEELGEGGLLARSLDVAVEESMAGISSLSALSSALAVQYLERIKHALKALSLPSGVFITTRGYVAHLLVEADPEAYGAPDVPVLGTLPPARGGRPPQDLLTRVIKATRRGFEQIRAIDHEVWDGFVSCTTWRVHERDTGLVPGAVDAGGPDDGPDHTGDLDGDDLDEEDPDEPDLDEDDPDDVPGYLDPIVIDGLIRFGWLLRQVDIHYGLGPERTGS